MIYRSNIQAPDLTPHFKHSHSRVLEGYSFGHDVLSDWADKAPDDPTFGLYRKCGFWSHDEAAILYAIGKQKAGHWLDIGSHTGWTAAHLLKAGCLVTAIEPMLTLPEFRARFEENTAGQRTALSVGAMRSDEFFAMSDPRPMFDGVVIDGDHEWTHPLADAIGAHNRLKRDGVILFHDAMGGPTWQGIFHLMDQFGYRCHIYLTPQIVACCWRGDWTPPEHVPDPAIDWHEIQTNHMKLFQWGRVTCDSF